MPWVGLIAGMYGQCRNRGYGFHKLAFFGLIIESAFFGMFYPT